MTDPIPSRYLPTRLHVVPDAMPAEWINRMGLWLHAHRADLRPSHHGANGDRWLWRMEGTAFDEGEHLPALRSCVMRHLDAAAKALQVEPKGEIGMHARMLHHGNGSGWSVWTSEEAAIGFEFFLYSVPKQFAGGEVEFQDGTIVEPVRGSLVFWPGAAMQRVRRVECYSALAAHGRWSIAGYVW